MPVDIDKLAQENLNALILGNRIKHNYSNRDFLSDLLVEIGEFCKANEEPVDFPSESDLTNDNGCYGLLIKDTQVGEIIDILMCCLTTLKYIYNIPNIGLLVERCVSNNKRRFDAIQE